MASNLQEALEEISSLVNDSLDALLPQELPGRIGENRLARSMRYSTFAGGKRLRPFLVITTADLFGVSRQVSLRVACAVECVHTFSLIHDDLPALDDDDERRGQASCHKEFDEATAILAGDALLAYAFDILSHKDTHNDPAVLLRLVSTMAQSVGINGMVGGQMIDLISEDRELSLEQITRLQRLKTGALFEMACESGAILGKAPANTHRLLKAYANDIGLAFQITDDLLDAVEEDNRDNKSQEKGTFVSIMGVEKSKMQAETLINQAISYLECFGARADLLRELAQFVITRKF